jgi:hypothetical protein
MSNNQNTSSQPATNDSVAQGMAALETLATVWCAKTDVSSQAQALAELAGHEAADSTLFLATAIREFAKSAYMEGAYQHLIDSRDKLTQVKAERDRIRIEIVGALTDAGIYMLAGDSDPTAPGEIKSAIRRVASNRPSPEAKSGKVKAEAEESRQITDAQILAISAEYDLDTDSRILNFAREVLGVIGAQPPTGFMIRHADGVRWRTLDSIGMPDWTDKQEEGVCFSLRVHAERYCEDDPDDVQIVAVADHTTPVFDLIAHLERQAKFSLETFGPGPRVKMVLDHIRKELIEIEAKPTDLFEWVDVVLLALDGAWRAGFASKDIAVALGGKLAQNEARSWPDWRDQDSDKAIEHTPNNYDTRVAEPLTYPEEMTAAIRTVLGRPNFTCIRIAHLLRRSGVEIAHKAEDEQASVIHFLLKFALRHGEMWADVADEELMALRHAALKATGDTA